MLCIILNGDAAKSKQCFCLGIFLVSGFGWSKHGRRNHIEKERALHFKGIFFTGSFFHVHLILTVNM